MTTTSTSTGNGEAPAGDGTDRELELAGLAGARAPSLRGMWALGFVVLSLAALAALPAYFGRRVDDAQTRITDVLEPAARLSSNLRLLKARQLARMEGYLATGDPSFREPYNAAIAEEDAVLDELRGLARAIDIEVFDRVARLGIESVDWRLLNQRVFDVGIEAGARDRVLSGFNRLQSATRELDLAIQRQVDLGRRRVEAEQRLQSLITAGLAIVALFATLIVGRVAYRYRDLTLEHEHRRRDAVRARREVDALLEATGDGVLGIDMSGRCISLNRAGVQLLGYTEREITGRDVHDTLFHSRADGRPSPRESSPILAAIAEGRVLESETGAVIWRRRSIPFPARWSLRPMIDGTELRGGVLTFTDMTEIHEKEEELRRAIRQREEVVSIVSHDLRNPLGVALAAADLLLDLPLDERQRRRQAEIIRRSGERMQNLIEDLLDVSRIEAGVFVVRPSLEDLVPILEETRELFRPPAESKGLRLEVTRNGVGPRARVDRDRIIQALSNLLENAIRVTPEGGRVTVSAREDGDEVVIAVEDTGPGIPPEMVQRLFERFAMGEGRDGGSAGLGLTIVKGVAEAHDGRVTVETEVGRGSVFALRLPKRGPAVGETRGEANGG